MVAWSRLGGSWIRCWAGRAWHITRSLFSGFSVLFFFYFISPWLQTVSGSSVVWEALGLYEGGPARLGGKALIYIRCKKKGISSIPFYGTISKGFQVEYFEVKVLTAQVPM